MDFSDISLKVLWELKKENEQLKKELHHERQQHLIIIEQVRLNLKHLLTQVPNIQDYFNMDYLDNDESVSMSENDEE